MNDSEFSKYIKSIKPNWFKLSANKQKLLSMALSGYARPQYDPEFSKFIENYKPNWFKS